MTFSSGLIESYSLAPFDPNSPVFQQALSFLFVQEFHPIQVNQEVLCHLFKVNYSALV